MRPKTSTLWWLVCCGALILYALTSQTNVSWQDSSNFQWRMLTVDYRGILGLAVSHPVLIFLGRIAEMLPVGDVLWRLNALSAAGMAIALANFMVLVALLTNRRWLGVLFAIMLGVCHITWWLATITESYAWVVAGLTAELWLFVRLIRKPGWTGVVLLGILNGAGLALHNFALLPLPVYFLTVVYLVTKKQIPLWSLGLAAVAFVAGASPYVGMVVDMAVATGDPMAAVSSALFAEGYEAVTNVSFVSEYSKANAALASLSFANVILPLAVVGWIRFRRELGSVEAWALGAITAIHVVFIIRYDSPDQFTSMLPAFVMVTIGAAVGARFLIARSGIWMKAVIVSCVLSIVAMPVLYGTLPAILHMIGVEVKRTRILPFRDEARYWITPWKHNENSAQLFAEAALAEALPDGVILADENPMYPLLVTRYLQPRFSGVGIQYDGEPLPPYDPNPDAFRKALKGRLFFLVSPISNYIRDGERILTDAEFDRGENKALYRALWKTKNARDTVHNKMESSMTEPAVEKQDPLP